MRILGLDFGSKTVGVAVSDELMLTAQGLEIVRRQSPNKLRQTLARIEQIVTEYQVERIVLGYPKNMNNTEGERCEKTKEFAQMLERRTGLSVVLWDERTYDGCSRPAHDGEWNTQRESQTVCG